MAKTNTMTPDLTKPPTTGAELARKDAERTDRQPTMATGERVAQYDAAKKQSDLDDEVLRERVRTQGLNVPADIPADRHPNPENHEALERLRTGRALPPRSPLDAAHDVRNAEQRTGRANRAGGFGDVPTQVTQVIEQVGTPVLDKDGKPVAPSSSAPVAGVTAPVK